MYDGVETLNTVQRVRMESTYLHRQEIDLFKTAIIAYAAATSDSESLRKNMDTLECLMFPAMKESKEARVKKLESILTRESSKTYGVGKLTQHA